MNFMFQKSVYTTFGWGVQWYIGRTFWRHKNAIELPPSLRVLFSCFHSMFVLYPSTHFPPEFILPDPHSCHLVRRSIAP